MRVRLILTSGSYHEISMKDYPLAVDEEEARSMMFRDNDKTILKVVLEGGRVQYNVEPIGGTS